MCKVLPWLVLKTGFRLGEGGQGVGCWSERPLICPICCLERNPPPKKKNTPAPPLAAALQSVSVWVWYSYVNPVVYTTSQFRRPPLLTAKAFMLKFDPHHLLLFPIPQLSLTCRTLPASGCVFGCHHRAARIIPDYLWSCDFFFCGWLLMFFHHHSTNQSQRYYFFHFFFLNQLIFGHDRSKNCVLHCKIKEKNLTGQKNNLL